MCSIIGISGIDIKNKLLTMLNVLSHRGPDGRGVYCDGKTFYNDEIINSNIPESDFMLAHNLLSIIGNNELQPIISNNLVLVSNAELYNYRELIDEFSLNDLKTDSDCEIILKIIEYFYEDNLKDAVLKSINVFDGDYAFCIYDGKDFMVLRDDVGVKPVYYSKVDKYIAFSSEQKALKAANLKNIDNLKPTDAIINNNIIKIRDEKIHNNEFRNYEYAKNALKEAISTSVLKRIEGLDKVSVLFSGGIDSTLIAVLLKKYDIDTTLYTIGTKNSQDLKFAKEIASNLHLPLKTRIINQKDIEDYFYPTINAIESTNLMKIGVGMTVNMTSQLAQLDNHKVILSGQGADELFCGYNRYKNKYDKPKELIKELEHDLNNMYEVNLERDDKATMNNSVELRVPYLDKKVIDVALHMPINYLIHSNDDNIRKHILRDVAYELGVPENIAYRPKKAAQYGTGIDKILRKKIIKKESYNNILNK